MQVTSSTTIYEWFEEQIDYASEMTLYIDFIAPLIEARYLRILARENQWELKWHWDRNMVTICTHHKDRQRAMKGGCNERK